MSESLSQLAAQAVDLSRRAGANDAFTTASRVRMVEFRRRDGNLERVQESTSRGLGLRLWVDGRFSEHATSDLAIDRLEPFIEQAVAMTRVLDEDRHRQITDPGLYANRPTNDLDLVDQRILDLTPATRSELCRAIESAARQHEQVISVTTAIVDHHGQAAAASSNGFAGQKEWTKALLSGSVTLRGEGEGRPDGHFRAEATHLAEASSPAHVGRRALERAAATVGSVRGPTRRTTLVVEPWMASSLVRRLLQPANAEALSQERSYFQGQLGQAMLSERLTITDDPQIPRGLGSRHFDAEGIAARSIPMIEAGRAANLYVDTYYGRKTELAPTTGSSSNVIVTPGQATPAELVAATSQGVLVTTWIGGNADATTGDFSIGMRGHLIENGRVGQPVGEMNVSGNLLELFRNLTAVGSDPWRYSRYQSPTLVFDNVQLSGA